MLSAVDQVLDISLVKVKDQRSRLQAVPLLNGVQCHFLFFKFT